MGQYCFARCRLSSVVVCHAAGGQAGRPPGAWTFGRPTLHRGPVRLRPVRATPCSVTFINHILRSIVILSMFVCSFYISFYVACAFVIQLLMSLLTYLLTYLQIKKKQFVTRLLVQAKISKEQTNYIIEYKIPKKCKIKMENKRDVI